ncbi:glycosyltransferase family 4 protein [Pseudomonas sp. ICMP22404]|uniref:glycosyltransferase n=1 Tax=Pseudomonas sp. ICMP22404 TaxID=2583807 RepID=UPI00111A82B2|nr:glycosyltransferase [Pseudomonas sp. ICMP22404]TNF81279.1 glycosyltransferase family 4 protein [Pseudomonas sp. ICMP22404]
MALVGLVGFKKVGMRKNIVLLGFYVGDEYFEKYSKGDSFPQVAAYKLEGRFLDAMRLGGAFVNTVASIAVSTYPRNKRIFFPGMQKVNNEGSCRIVPLLNLPMLKMLSRLLGTLYGLFRLRKSKTDMVCVYAAHTPNLVAAYVFRKLLGVNYFVYIPDLPIYMDMGVGRLLVTRVLKKIDSWLIDNLISRSAGVFVASEYMVADSSRWSKKPFMVLEGIVHSGSEASHNVPKEEESGIIFYAGGLSKAYGIVELVEGFIKANTGYELWLCGRGELESYLSEVSKCHSSIKYLGFLSAKEVESIQARAACLILTRNPQERYTRYSFPSKLLEYMASGIPVLTTRLDGIPKEYFEFLNVIEDSTSEGICAALTDFCAANRQILFKKAEYGRVWLLRNKSSSAVGRKIISFMEEKNDHF